MDRVDAFWSAGAQQWKPLPGAARPPHRDRNAVIACVVDVCRQIDGELGPALLIDPAWVVLDQAA